MVKTKIIATLGPASSTETIIRKMMKAGLDVVRLNCSHSSLDQRLSLIKIVRRLNKKYHRRLRILLDLEGPRIRLGKIKYHRNIPVKKGQVIRLIRSERPGEGRVLPLDYPGSFLDFKGADNISIDDGLIVLKIEDLTEERIKARVVVGGLIKERKGVNLPGARLKFVSPTPPDLDNIEFGLQAGVDYIAQSFVRDKGDIERIKQVIRRRGSCCRVIAKIEDRQGVFHREEIIAASDGVMVARGDLGVSFPIWEVPIIQKRIIRCCNKKRKLVITATQMLESMVEHLRPTRAEVGDVANAILDGTDFVMLSAETAVGSYPVETVKMMNEIIKFTEQNVKQIPRR